MKANGDSRKPRSIPERIARRRKAPADQAEITLQLLRQAFDVEAGLRRSDAAQALQEQGRPSWQHDDAGEGCEHDRLRWTDLLAEHVIRRGAAFQRKLDVLA